MGRWALIIKWNFRKTGEELRDSGGSDDFNGDLRRNKIVPQAAKMKEYRGDLITGI
jgi:hypothetical protein